MKREAPDDSHENSDAEVESLVSGQEHVGNPREFKGRQIQMMAVGMKSPFPRSLARRLLSCRGEHWKRLII